MDSAQNGVDIIIINNINKALRSIGTNMKSFIFRKKFEIHAKIKFFFILMVFL